MWSRLLACERLLNEKLGHIQGEMQRLRLELGRLAQERDSYKQKCDALHRANHQQQHQQKQQQQQQQQQHLKANSRATSVLPDGSPNHFYL